MQKLASKTENGTILDPSGRVRLGLSSTTAGSWTSGPWPIRQTETTRSDTRSSGPALKGGIGVATHPVAQLSFRVIPDAKPLQHPHRPRPQRAHTFHTIYDVAGNQTRALADDGVTWLRYEYDYANRVQVVRKDDANQTLVQAFQYGATNARLIDYDPLGTGLATFYATAGGTVLTEYTEYNQNVQTWTRSYTYLGGKQLSTITTNGSGGEDVVYNHPDRLGTRLITNQSAGSAFEQINLPFGRPLDAESTFTINNRRFTTYERSPITNLDYAVNRTYDSKLGRFTQADPKGMGSVDLMQPQTLNLYNYCANDPINRTDPLGLNWFTKFWHVFKAVLNVIAVIVAIVAIVIPFVNAVVIGVKVGLSLGLKAGVLAFGNALKSLGLEVLRIIIREAERMVVHTIISNVKESVHEHGLSFGSLFRGFFRGIKQAAGFMWAAITRKLPDGLVPIHGYFCAPQYGVDGPTGSQAPMDDLDRACKQHDEDMLRINEMYDRGEISKKDRDRLKTRYDLQFMWRAAKSGDPRFGALLEISFFVRIVARFA